MTVPLGVAREFAESASKSGCIWAHPDTVTELRGKINFALWDAWHGVRSVPAQPHSGGISAGLVGSSRNCGQPRHNRHATQERAQVVKRAQHKRPGRTAKTERQRRALRRFEVAAAKAPLARWRQTAALNASTLRGKRVITWDDYMDYTG